VGGVVERVGEGMGSALETGEKIKKIRQGGMGEMGDRGRRRG